MHDHRYRVSHGNDWVKVIPVKIEDTRLIYRMADSTGAKAAFGDWRIRIAMPHQWKKVDHQVETTDEQTN